ncbi:hypothetical protein [Flagellimonas onchidii]|uniref:hypothetical protein n=1 Tax=Flagellimonas onchidii TaxID=2562684 RepID=UPI0010A64869|nr:hypothetical protein [Allomuricauda onchidii]
MVKNILVFMVLCILLLSCTKEDIPNSLDLGVWISLDKKDTLDFKTENHFLRSNEFMTSDNYDYSLNKDSITIGYRGKMFVGVQPTTHNYSLQNNILTIDFTNEQCYGFDREVIYYQKQ